MGEIKLPSTDEDLLNLSPDYSNLDDGSPFLRAAEILDEEGDRCVGLLFTSDFGIHILKNTSSRTLPTRADRDSARMARLKRAIEAFDPANIIEYMSALRDDV